ncbi:MAG: hypothetical protein WD042_12545 [Phycisphaeraceae bacterium]
MSEAATTRVQCPSCNRSVRWRAELAGRKIKCTCGTVWSLPDQPPASGAAAPPLPTPAPALPNSVFAAAALASKSRLDQTLANREDEVHGSPFIEQMLPWILLAGGAAAAPLLNIALLGELGFGLTVWAAMVGLQVLVFLPVAFITLTLVSRWFNCELGALTDVLRKLAPIVLGTGAAADAVFLYIAMMMGGDYYTPVVGFPLYLLLCGLPLAIFFGWGLGETTLTIFFFLLPRVVIVLTLAMAFPKWFE